MSQSQNALTVAELWDETQRLNQEIAALRMRLARHEKIESPSARRPASASTRAVSTHTAGASACDRCDDDLWGVWPYCWATGACDYLSERLHSFHAKLHDARLARRNKRVRAAFWQKPHPEEITLKLL